MKIARKYDTFTVIIAVVFLIAFVVSYQAINAISIETSRLFDVSREFDYLTRVKDALANVQHSSEHFIHVNRKSEYGNTVMRDLTNFEQTLRLSPTIKLDNEEKALLDFALAELPAFSSLLNELIKKEQVKDPALIEAYKKMREEYIERILRELNSHWKEDLAKVTEMSGRAAQAKSDSTKLLLVLSGLMVFLLIASRLMVTRFIIRPIRSIEDISRDIARGDISKRIDISSDDELGSLARSINEMAGAIEDKLEKLESSVSKEQALVREQTILNELMGFIATGAELDLVLRIFLGRTRDLMRAEHSGIFIMEPRDPLDPELKLFFNTFEENTGMECGRAMLRGVFINVVKSLTPMRVNTPLTETPMSHVNISNLMAVPLTSVDRGVLGLIMIINKEGGFTQTDEDMLFNFSFQAFQAITMQQEVVRYATTDGLTGLHNHRVFRNRLHEEIERAKRYEREVSLLMVDIDHFKTFNDTYGHQSGDVVLRTVAGIIQKKIRTTDFAARYGGEEFAVVLPETSGNQAFVVAERLRTSIADKEVAAATGEKLAVTVSIGIGTFPRNCESEDSLIKKADDSLYTAKRNGRNIVCN